MTGTAEDPHALTRAAPPYLQYPLTRSAAKPGHDDDLEQFIDAAWASLQAGISSGCAHPMRPLLLVRSDNICAIIAPVWFVVRAAELDGVQLPDTLQIDGKFGPRTYSLLGIHIDVASLSLEHLSTDPQEIIQSPNTKFLTVRFQRSVSADAVRKASVKDSKTIAWLPAVLTRRMSSGSLPWFPPCMRAITIPGSLRSTAPS